MALRNNNRILVTKNATQQKTLSNLVKDNISVQDPSKIIFNLSIYELSDCEKRLLLFNEDQDFVLLFNEDQDFVKTRTKEGALSFYRNYKNNVPHLSKEEFLVFQNYVKIKISLSKSRIKVILL